MALSGYCETACELQELIEECLNARLDVLDADSETRNMVKEYATISFEAGFSVCMIIELLRNQMWITKGLKAKENEERTILAANARESAKAARRWQPYREEFQRLVSEDGMKPDTARSTILNNWAEPKGAPSMKTARKWLRLDGEAD